MISGVIIFSVILVCWYLLNLIVLWTRLASYASYWSAKNNHQKAKNSQSQLLYVAFGDSTAQGIGASRPNFSYVAIVKRQIEKHSGSSVRLVNLSKSGDLVSDVVARQIPQMKSMKLRPDIVTVQIGSNNILHMADENFEEYFVEMLKQLPRGSYVANLPWFIGRASRVSPKAVRYSQIIKKLVSKSKKHHFINLEAATRSRWGIHMVSLDLLHPSNYAHKQWSRAFLNKVLPNIIPKN